MDLKDLPIVYFFVGMCVFFIEYFLGWISLDQLPSHLIMLALPTELNIITILPPFIGLVFVVVYLGLNQK